MGGKLVCASAPLTPPPFFSSVAHIHWSLQASAPPSRGRHGTCWTSHMGLTVYDTLPPTLWALEHSKD